MMKLLPLLAATALLNALSLGAQEIQVSPTNRTISISASADASTIADLATVSIGLHARASLAPRCLKLPLIR